MLEFSIQDAVIDLQQLACEQQDLQAQLEALLDRYALLEQTWTRKFHRFSQLPAPNAMGYWIEHEFHLPLTTLPRFVEQMPLLSYSFVSEAEYFDAVAEEHYHKHLSTRLFESTQARLDDLSAAEQHYQYFSAHAHIAADAAGHQARALFVELMQLLQPVFCHHSPDYGGSTPHPTHIPSPDLALSMCLERSAGFLAGDKPPEWIWAQQHFAEFPHLGYNGAGRFKNRRTAPERLGWLNGWSPAICALLGFPDAGRDAAILPLCQQLASGHWLVQLTPEPLNLGRADHVQAMAWAYQRFDQIGTRRKPVAASKASKATK